MISVSTRRVSFSLTMPRKPQVTETRQPGDDFAKNPSIRTKISSSGLPQGAFHNLTRINFLLNFQRVAKKIKNPQRGA